MWNPPVELTLAEQKIAARTRKRRKFFVFLREKRHVLLDAAFQETLAATYSAEPGALGVIAGKCTGSISITRLRRVPPYQSSCAHGAYPHVCSKFAG